MNQKINLIGGETLPQTVLDKSRSLVIKYSHQYENHWLSSITVDDNDINYVIPIHYISDSNCITVVIIRIRLFPSFHKRK